MIPVIGHRGAMGLAPENTMAGFRLAMELGCDVIELDVRLTRDGGLAVIHDERLERTTNGKGLVRSHDMVQIKTLDAGGGEKVPTLLEVLDAFASSDVRFQIELKGEQTEVPTVELVRSAGFAQRVTFTSFFHRRVLQAKEMLPEADAGVIVFCNPVDPVSLLAAARADNMDGPSGRIDANLVEALHRAGKKVVAWVADAEDDLVDRVARLGVDAIGSDWPDRVLKRLKNGM